MTISAKLFSMLPTGSGEDFLSIPIGTKWILATPLATKFFDGSNLF